MGCVYQATVPWNLRREKICDCEMVEVKVGTSLYEMRHTCVHRPLVELYPLSGIVSVKYLTFYVFTTVKTLCLKAEMVSFRYESSSRKLLWSLFLLQPENPNLLFFRFLYSDEGVNTLCYVMTMPNQRMIYIYIMIHTFLNTRGLLTPLRRPANTEYLSVLDCGRVPINNLDPVIRVSIFS